MPVSQMDPLSVATVCAALAKAAYEVVRAIRCASEATKSVDITLQTFAGEISALSEALTLINVALKDPKVKELESQKNHDLTTHVFHSLKRLLAECQDTLVRLSSIIQTASRSNRNSIFRRTVTAIKLDFNSVLIAQIRQQINSYVSATQMTLSMLNISLVLTKDDVSVSDRVALDSKIKALQISRANLQSSLDKLAARSSQHTSSEKLSSFNDYLRVSGSILSNATDYYESTRSSSSTADDTTSGEGVDSSVDGLTPGQRSLINSWKVTMDVELPETEDFKTSINNRRVVLASKKIEAKKYVDAEKLLQTFLLSAEQLPNYQHTEARFLLAISYQAQGKYKEALETLEKLLATDEIPTTQILHIKSLMAETYILNSKPEAALPYALGVCEGRHNLRKDDDYFRACVLVAKTYSALGEHAEAELYLEDAPQKYRAEVLTPEVDYLRESNNPFETNTLRQQRSKDSHVQEHPSFGRLLKAEKQAQKLMGSTKTSDTTRADRKVTAEYQWTIKTFTHVKCISFSSDNRLIAATAFYTQYIAILSASSGDLLHTLKEEDAVYHKEISVAFIPNTDMLASVCGNDTIRIWNVYSKEVVHNIRSTSLALDWLRVSPDGSAIVSGSQGNFPVPRGSSLSPVPENNPHLRISHIAPQTSSSAFISSHTVLPFGSSIEAMCFSCDNELLASACDTLIQLWDVKTGEMITCVDVRRDAGHSHTTDHKEKICGLSFSVDGRRIAATSQHARVRIWDIEGGGVTEIMAYSQSTTYSGAKFSSDGRFLAHCNPQSGFQLLDATTYATQQILPKGEDHDSYTMASLISPDSTMIVGSGRSQQLTLWRLAPANTQAEQDTEPVQEFDGYDTRP